MIVSTSPLPLVPFLVAVPTETRGASSRQKIKLGFQLFLHLLSLELGLSPGSCSSLSISPLTSRARALAVPWRLGSRLHCGSVSRVFQSNCAASIVPPQKSKARFSHERAPKPLRTSHIRHVVSSTYLTLQQRPRIQCQQPLVLKTLPHTEYKGNPQSGSFSRSEELPGFRWVCE